MKPMKPARAWAAVDENGSPIRSLQGTPMLRNTWHEARAFEIWNEDETQQYTMAVRVRILDDAAVERAIAVLLDLAVEMDECALDTAGTPSFQRFESKANQAHAAIRDLGGKT